MRYLFFVTVILALPALCLAGKFKIEEPQFDLRAATSTNCDYTSIRGYVYSDIVVGGFALGIGQVNITLYKYLKYVDGTTGNYKSDEAITIGNGNYKFCDLRIGEYLLVAGKKGYDEAKYRLELTDKFQFIKPKAQADFTLYKKGKSPVRNSFITGTIIPDSSEDYPLLGTRITIIGKQTKFKKTKKEEDDGLFEFNYLKADTYTFIAKQNTKSFKKKIVLEKNMTYDFYIDWQ